MKKLVYVGNVGWANSAPAVHIQNRARLMSKLGIHTCALSTYPGEANKMEDIPELEYRYMKDYRGPKKIRGLQWHVEQFVCIYSYMQIIGQLKEIRPDVVVVYEVNSIMLQLLLCKYCRKHGMKFVIETTEWHGKEKYNNMRTRLIVQQKNLQKKITDKKCGNIIVISHYLEQHYKSQKCNVVRIPPLFDDIDGNLSLIRHKDKRCNASVRLVFAGTLGKKDLLEPLLNAIITINSRQIRISFDVIGPDISEIKKVLKIENLEMMGIFCHGRLPHDNVLEYVKEADFSVLLRQNMRYAKAGVSTKFIEAMCLGVPSICTKVGGTDLFVEDGNNGFLINDNSEKEIQKILEHMLSMTNEEIIRMKTNTYEYAKKNFATDAYLEKMRDFLMRCN